MLITALLVSAVLASPQAAADPVAAQDGVISTAPATPVVLDGAAAPAVTVDASPSQAVAHGLSTDEQIAQWLTARAAGPAPFDGAPIWRDDRKPHGEVSVGVGTDGYRDYGAAMSLSVGKNGRLDLSYRQVENGYPQGYGYDGYGQGDYGYGDYGYGGYGHSQGAGRSRSSVIYGYGEPAEAAAGSRRP